MTDKLDALDKLIDAVEAGKAITTDARVICQSLGWRFPDARMRHILPAEHGSLDAALALHEALLPGWALERLTMWPGSNGQCTANLWGTHDKKGERWHNFTDGRADAEAETPARAWLLAILRAYRSIQAAA